jgi:hypothetical protein
MITTGTKYRSWDVLSVSPDGRRACCGCGVCGTVRILSVAALTEGSAPPSCGCAPLTLAEAAALRPELRAEAERRNCERHFKEWKN